MSHVTELKAEEATVRDLDALEAAAAECGLELVRGQTTYTTWQTHNGSLVGDAPLPEGMTEADVGKCNHAIRIPRSEQRTQTDQYEIGLVDQGDGSYKMRYDYWGGAIDKRAGKQLGKLTQHYQCEVAKAQARRRGYRVEQEKSPDGKLRLRAYPPAQQVQARR